MVSLRALLAMGIVWKESLAKGEDMKARFPEKILAEVQKSMVVGIRAGTEPHRIIGIWAVAVEGRVFVRSWSQKPQGWYRTFLTEPRGIMQIGNRVINVRSIRTRSERLKDAVDRAYKEKYNTPGSLKYVRGFRTTKRRETTMELVPLR